jgi:phosphatidylcholine synthase
MQDDYGAHSLNGQPTAQQKLLAWSAHLFTASGAIWGLLTLLAITNGEWKAAFLWISVAIIIDSFDGYLARAVRVKEFIPEFDGALLDNMLDYLNYVFVPAYFLVQADLLPPSVSILGASLILLSSCYQFSQGDAKTDDHYFKGFPSYWNILAIYLLVLDLDPWTNFIVVVILAILVFVPVKYIYPSRTNFYPAVNRAATGLWAITFVAIMLTYPNTPSWLLWLSLLCALFYTGMSLYATFATSKPST